MKATFKIAAAGAVLLCLAGMTAKAGMEPRTGMQTDTLRMKKDSVAIPPASVVDEVIWVVGDEPILKSDVEVMRLQGEMQGMKWENDPDCSIPEELAVQKLFLHQAAIDSITVTEAEITQGVDQQINYWISQAGSKEKLEEYRKQSITQMKEEMRTDFKNRELVERMKRKIVENIAVTPADVRNYFKNLPQDSLPFVPTEVEVQIISQQPRIPQDEINRVKDELRDYTDRVTKGETTFATLARLYSEDPGTARQGGELGYVGRGTLDPAFAAVAFNLTDPSRISKVVETEFGYHIIQLIDKRGDKINVRHILRKPHVPQASVEQGLLRLDSIGNDIRSGKFPFGQVASYLSDDKNTKNNNGLMANTAQGVYTSKFQMKDLPTEVARVVDTLKVGEVSKAFEMVNAHGKTVCAIVKLKSRTEGHRATMATDFQILKEVVLNKEREKKLHDWVVEKIKHTYVRMNDRYKNCNFQYQGWVK